MMEVKNYNSLWFAMVLVDKLPTNVFTDLTNVFNARVISKEELSHFLCQCHHESGGFKNFTENLGYSAKRLQQIFPNRFKTIEDAKKVTQGGQQAIANSIYNGKIGNRLGSNDGWNTRGRGAIQLTGMANYKAFDDMVPENIVEDGLYDLVSTKYPITSAVWFFDKKKIWSKCKDKASVKVVTKIINPACLGLKERENLYSYYLGMLLPLQYTFELNDGIITPNINSRV